MEDMIQQREQHRGLCVARCVDRFLACMDGRQRETPEPPTETEPSLPPLTSLTLQRVASLSATASFASDVCEALARSGLPISSAERIPAHLSNGRAPRIATQNVWMGDLPSISRRWAHSILHSHWRSGGGAGGASGGLKGAAQQHHVVRSWEPVMDMGKHSPGVPRWKMSTALYAEVLSQAGLLPYFF